MLPPRLVTRLTLHPLPGNVRQLRNIARHVAIASRGSGAIVVGEGLERLLSAPPLSERPDAPAPEAAEPTSQKRPGELTESEVMAALEQHGWSPGRTAASLGLPTSTLHDLLRRLGIRRASDLSEAELTDAEARFGGNLDEMAKALRVSPRALRLVFGSRKTR